MQSQERLSWLNSLLPGSKAAPTAAMLSASQPELKAMMHGETGKLLELRRELEKEMNRITEDFVISNYKVIETHLDKIIDIKHDYQNNIEIFVEMYSEVLENPDVLEEWTEEVKNIGKTVKELRMKARNIAMQVAATERAGRKSWLKDNLPVPRKIATLPSDPHFDTGWLKNILPVPRKEAAMLLSSDPSHDKSLLRNILPLPRERADLAPASHSDPDCDSRWVRNILPLPREKAALPPASHSDPEHNRIWLKDIQPVPRMIDSPPHARDHHHDSSWLKNILPLPRVAKAQLSGPHSDRSWLSDILPVPQKKAELLHCDAAPLHADDILHLDRNNGPGDHQQAAEDVQAKEVNDGHDIAKTSPLAGIAVPGSATVTGYSDFVTPGTGQSGPAQAVTSSTVYPGVSCASGTVTDVVRSDAKVTEMGPTVIKPVETDKVTAGPAIEADDTTEVASETSNTSQVTTETADTCDVAKEAANSSKVATEAADTSEVAGENADTGVKPTEVAGNGEVASEDNDKDEAAAKPDNTGEAANGSKPGITGPALSQSAMSGTAATAPGMGETAVKMKAVQAPRVKLMWERFWDRMLFASQDKYSDSRKYYYLVRQTVSSVFASAVSKNSKCLNSTSRALRSKQAVATLLSVPGQGSTWSWLTEDEPDIPAGKDCGIK